MSPSGVRIPLALGGRGVVIATPCVFGEGAPVGFGLKACRLLRVQIRNLGSVEVAPFASNPSSPHRSLFTKQSTFIFSFLSSISGSLNPEPVASRATPEDGSRFCPCSPRPQSRPPGAVGPVPAGNAVTHLRKKTVTMRHNPPPPLRNLQKPSPLNVRAQFRGSLARCVTNRPSAWPQLAPPPVCRVPRPQAPYSNYREDPSWDFAA